MITKAILTGGGRATRLRPITSTINKHLIKLAGQPMIWHAIEKVVKAGIKEIYINTNPGETELQKSIGDGSRWGVSITFFEQTGGPQGIAHVVKQAQKFIGDDPFMFYLSDNIILADLNNLIDKFEQKNYDCLLALSQVNDPERFGVPYFDANGNLIEVKEKPNNPPNNFAVTGIYLYGPKLFFDAFNHIQPSTRGEYEISSIHSYLLNQNKKVGCEEITGWWKDTGKPEDLLIANKLLLEQMNLGQTNYLSDASSTITNTDITGPAIIGKNCTIDNCQFKAGVTIGDNCILKNVSLKNTIIFDDCQIDNNLNIQNSIIGKSTHIYHKEDNVTHRLILGDNTVIEL